jgi:ligand-binding sensor domain-containing protein
MSVSGEPDFMLNGTIKCHRNVPLNFGQLLSHDNITRLYKDSTNTLWIGTLGGGLNKFDPKTETFVHYRHDENNPDSLIHDILRSISKDKRLPSLP